LTIHHDWKVIKFSGGKKGRRKRAEGRGRKKEEETSLFFSKFGA
jgi:hypothetical protein